MKPILLLVAVYSLILNQSNKKMEAKKFPPVKQVSTQAIAEKTRQGTSVVSGFRYGVVSYIGFYGASFARPLP